MSPKGREWLERTGMMYLMVAVQAGTYYLQDGSGLLLSERPAMPYKELVVSQPILVVPLVDEAWNALLAFDPDWEYQEEDLVWEGNGQLLVGTEVIRMVYPTGKWPDYPIDYSATRQCDMNVFSPSVIHPSPALRAKVKECLRNSGLSQFLSESLRSESAD